MDGNSCDARSDILRRDLINIAIKTGTGGCEVLSGDLADPYTGVAVHYVRGGASEVDIDHVVSLGDAWQTGAQAMSVGQRTALANDPLNLLAVGASVNREKGDADAAAWLPPNTAFRCTYVARQIAVKAGYRLWVTAAERDAMNSVLSGCPGQQAAAGAVPPPHPDSAVAPADSPPAATQPVAPAPVAPAPVVPQPAPAGVYYPNCAAARAAGAAPLYAGQPGYRSGLDRDGDGRACE